MNQEIKADNCFQRIAVAREQARLLSPMGRERGWG